MELENCNKTESVKSKLRKNLILSKILQLDWAESKQKLNTCCTSFGTQDLPAGISNILPVLCFSLGEVSQHFLFIFCRSTTLGWTDFRLDVQSPYILELHYSDDLLTLENLSLKHSRQHIHYGSPLSLHKSLSPSAATDKTVACSSHSFSHYSQQ